MNFSETARVAISTRQESLRVVLDKIKNQIEVFNIEDLGQMIDLKYKFEEVQRLFDSIRTIKQMESLNSEFETNPIYGRNK